MGSNMAVAAATGAALSASALATTGGPLCAQEVIDLPAEDRLIEAGFEELYRVGSLQGGDWDTFGRVAAVAFDPAGNLYVLDTQTARISMVDLGGNLVRQIGREGEGPGEFVGSSAPMLRFTVLGDGRIAVYDPGKRSFVLFRADGEFERVIPMGADNVVALVTGLQADHGAESVISRTEVSYLYSSREARSDAAREPPRRYVMRYGLSREEVVTDSAPVTDRMKAAYIEGELERLERSIERSADPMEKAMAEFRRAQLESIEYFHEVPVLLDLRTSPNGTIWVGRRGEDPGSSGPIWRRHPCNPILQSCASPL